jgi:hypothetical protein
LEKSLCDLHFETVRICAAQFLCCTGGLKGLRGLRDCKSFESFLLLSFGVKCAVKMKRPESVMDSGRYFSLLIMSVTEMGLILCKLFEGVERYERVLDFGNEENGD